MTSPPESDLVNYLHAQAHRVEFTSTLDTIENDLIYIPRTSGGRQPRRLAPLLALASAVLLIVALSVVADRSDPSPATNLAVASADTTADLAAEEVAEDTTLPSVSTVPLPVVVPLPGGAVLNGIEPSCTTTPDPVVFECNIPAFPEPLGTVDYTGYVSEIVDDTSHVSGGCRATNSDATDYLCYIGTRAIDEQIIGENFLGEWAPREYAAG